MKKGNEIIWGLIIFFSFKSCFAFMLPSEVPTHISSILSPASTQAPEISVLDLRKESAIETKVPGAELNYLEYLTAPETLTYSQKELKSWWMGFPPPFGIFGRTYYTLLASAVSVGNSLILFEVLNSLSQLEGAEPVNLKGFLPGVKISSAEGEVLIFPHILFPSHLIIFSKGKFQYEKEAKNFAFQLDERVVNLVLGLAQKIKEKYPALEREIKTYSFSEVFRAQDADKEILLTGIRPQRKDLPFPEDVNPSLLRVEEGRQWYRIGSGISLNLQVTDLTNLDLISFNLQFHSEQKGIEKPIIPLFLVELVDRNNKTAIARVDLNGYIGKEGRVNLDKSKFISQEGFNWEDVVSINFAFEYDLSGLEDYVDFVDLFDRLKLSGFQMGFRTPSELAILEERKEKEFLEQLLPIEIWFGGLPERRRKEALDRMLESYLSQTSGGIKNGGKSIFEVAADILVRDENLKFLAEKQHIRIKSLGSLQLGIKAELDLLKEFETILFTRVQDSILMMKLSPEEQTRLREEAWQLLVQEYEKKPLTPREYLGNHIISLIKCLLGVEDLGKGSYFYNALYWIGSQLPSVVRFSAEEERLIEQKVGERIQRLREMYRITEVSSTSKERIKWEVKVDIALQKVYKEMFRVGLPVTVDNFIRWVTKDFTPTELERYRKKLSPHYSVSEIDTILTQKYSLSHVQRIEEVLRASMAIKPFAEIWLGPQSSDYLRRIEEEKITDKEFMRLQLKGFADLIINELYVEIDEDKAILLDAKGGIHANVAAMGMGIELIAALTQIGIIEPEVGKEMCRKLMNSISYIQKNQPDWKVWGEPLTYLFGKYPFILIKRLAGKSPDVLRRVNLASEIDVLEGEGLIPSEKASDLKRSIGSVFLSEEDIGYLSNPGLPEQLERVDKYGWGGWLYHFVTTGDLSRSSNDVEISSVDTLGYFFYAKYACAVFPELAPLWKESFGLVDMDNRLLYRGVMQSYNLCWVTDLNRESDHRGFGLESWEYHTEERRLMDYTRILWKIIHGETGNFRNEFYNSLSRKYTRLMPEIGMEIRFPKSAFGGLWTFVGLFSANVGWNLAEFGKEYSLYREGQEAAWALHMLAMMRSGYSPYTVGPDTYETPDRGYVMSDGQSGGISIIEPYNDGTYSFYSFGNCNPMLGNKGAWREYLINRRSFQYDGRIPYDSRNPREDFWSSTVYLFSLGYYVMGLINRYADGLIWRTYNSMDDIRSTNEAIGLKPLVEVGFEPDNKYQDLIASLRRGNYRYEPEQAYSIAEDFVSYMVDLAYQSATRRDELGFKIFSYYLEHNDVFYEEALRLLDDVIGRTEGELLVRALALKFVINKNQHYYLSQRDAFADLAERVRGNEVYREIAVGIISRYDYEARGVIYKGYDPVRGEVVPVLSQEEIRQDLDFFPALGKTWTIPELEKVLSENRGIYFPIAEEAGILMPFIYGIETDKGEKVPGFLEIARRHGWEEAIRMFREELSVIQATLRPYVEKLLGRSLDLTNPDGKDAGFLAAWAAQVEGGLKNPPSEHLHTPIWEWGGLSQKRTLEYVIERIQRVKFVKSVLERAFGHVFDLLDDRGGSNSDRNVVIYWATCMEQKGWSEYEVIRGLSPNLGNYIVGIVGGLFGGFDWHNRRVRNEAVDCISAAIHLTDEEFYALSVPEGNRDWRPYDHLKLYINTNISDAQALRLVIRNGKGESAEYTVKIADLPRGKSVEVTIPIARYVLDDDKDGVLDKIVWVGFVERDDWKRYVHTCLDTNLSLTGINDFRNIVSISFQSIGGKTIFNIGK